jgi:hypothetical protein
MECEKLHWLKVGAERAEGTNTSGGRAMTGDQQLAANQLAESLVEAFIGWNQAYPTVTTDVAVHGFIDGCRRLLYQLSEHTKPDGSMEVVDEILVRLRQQLLQREP